MKQYVVTLKEELEDDYTFQFYCMADDPHHAKEQAYDAYPTCVILCALTVEDEQ